MYTSSGASSGVATSSTWSDLRGSLSHGVDAIEHRGFVALHESGPIALGDHKIGELVAAGACLDGFENLLHIATLPSGNRVIQGDHAPKMLPAGKARLRWNHGY